MKVQTQETSQNTTENNEPKKRRVARGAAKVAVAGFGLLASVGAINASNAATDIARVGRQLEQAAEEGTVTVEGSYDPDTNSFEHIPADSQVLGELSDEANEASDQTHEGLQRAIAGVGGAVVAASIARELKKPEKQ